MCCSFPRTESSYILALWRRSWNFQSKLTRLDRFVTDTTLCGEKTAKKLLLICQVRLHWANTQAAGSPVNTWLLRTGINPVTLSVVYGGKKPCSLAVWFSPDFAPTGTIVHQCISFGWELGLAVLERIMSRFWWQGSGSVWNVLRITQSSRGDDKYDSGDGETTKKNKKQKQNQHSIHRAYRPGSSQLCKMVRTRLLNFQFFFFLLYSCGTNTAMTKKTVFRTQGMSLCRSACKTGS